MLIGKITEDATKHLSEIQSLKELRFFIRDNKHDADGIIQRTEQTYSMLVRTMPQLTVVGNKTTDDITNGFQFNSNLYHITPNFGHGLFRLQHMHSRHSLPADGFLPGLTHLHFRGPILKVRTLRIISGYPRLESLMLTCLDSSDAEEFLDVIGHQLTELHLEAITGPLDMYLVFHFCPNLKKLTMLDCEDEFVVKHQMIKTKVCKSKFPMFKEFRSTFNYNAFDQLKFLLLQPNIESIYLSDLLLGKEDLNLVNELPLGISFPHLQKFQLRYLSNGENDVTAVGNICRFVLPRAPNLIEFAISWSENDVFDMWCEQESELFDLTSNLL